jgi:predicted nucleotidyltransferase component of viral defense system
MHEETLAKPTRKLFDKLAESPWISDFYLAGGTALAMRLGHRVSVDLDFFSEKAFNEAALIDKLVSIGDLRIFQKAPRSVTGSIDEVKVSFLGYEYPILTTGTLWSGVTIASMEDIACMKLDALSSRGTKRDFIDLYFIAKQIPLIDILRLFEQKFAAIRYNILHIKKSLVYFEDAESEPMPKMLVPVEWRAVKEFFIQQALSL